jgi:hypothetical protein
MLCCGIFALLAATALGAWRRLRAWPRTMLVLVAALLAASPVVAIATGAPTGGAIARAETWVLAMRSLCGGHHDQS